VQPVVDKFSAATRSGRGWNYSRISGNAPDIEFREQFVRTLIEPSRVTWFDDARAIESMSHSAEAG
jgi:hypothetical protein